jgi:hypothetical protein
MANICGMCSEPITPSRPGKLNGNIWRHDDCPQTGRCPLCNLPFGQLHRSVVVNGVRQHVPPCPEPARPTGVRALPYLPDFPKRLTE